MKPMLRKMTALLALCALCVTLLAGCRTEQQPEEQAFISRTGFMLDTIIEIKVYDWEDTNILTQAMEEIDRLEKLLGADVPGSDLDRLYQAAGQDWVDISPECEELLGMAQEFYALSQGYFDVTIGPLIDLWNIHDNTGHFPTQQELEEALSYVALEKLHVEPGRAFLEEAGMKVDLGGIAKGYIGDCVAKLLADAGVEHAIINLGLDIQLIGGHVDGNGFLIGVRAPFDDWDGIVQVLQLSGKSVVTAGTSERYFEEDGKRYHHILDPYTGYPADTRVLSVTVIADVSAIGDAWSTICLLMGPEAGLSLIEAQPDVEAMYILEDESHLMSSGYEAYVVEDLFGNG